MNIYDISRWCIAICPVVFLASCADDNHYEMDGIISNHVNFKAINLAVGDADETTSTGKRDYDYLENRDYTFSLDVLIAKGPTESLYKNETYDFKIEKQSEMWSGGYNDIEITFVPSRPEEKEATFTMPNGETFTATAENPTFIWTPDSTLRDIAYDYNRREYPVIKAESQYTIGKTKYFNAGYIFLKFSPEIRFNNVDDKWYYSSWAFGGPLSVPSYVKFTVENLTIGSDDSCVSDNDQFPETIVERNDTVPIPFIGYEGNHRIRKEVLTGNDFLMLGYTDVRFTFIPEFGQKEMTLTLPDGSNHLLTTNNPSYIWHLTREEVKSYYYYRTIYGRSSYTQGGLTFDCTSQVTMRAMTEIWYDAESGVFRSDYWW